MNIPVPIGLHTWSNRGEDDVGNLDDSLGSLFANLDNGFWMLLALESGTSPGNDRPSLANKSSTSRDPQCIGDNVVTGIKEDDFASGILKAIKGVSTFQRPDWGNRPYQ